MRVQAIKALGTLAVPDEESTLAVIGALTDRSAQVRHQLGVLRLEQYAEKTRQAVQHVTDTFETLSLHNLHTRTRKSARTAHERD